MATHQHPSPSAPQESSPKPTTTTTATATAIPTEHHTITCHCKAITLTFPSIREPDHGTALECLCSICRRYGALWSYYRPDEVQVEGEEALEAYIWGKKNLAFWRCGKCGCITHYTVVGGERKGCRVAVNCRMMGKEEFMELETVESEGE